MSSFVGIAGFGAFCAEIAVVLQKTQAACITDPYRPFGWTRIVRWDLKEHGRVLSAP